MFRLITDTNNKEDIVDNMKTYHSFENDYSFVELVKNMSFDEVYSLQFVLNEVFRQGMDLHR